MCPLWLVGTTVSSRKINVMIIVGEIFSKWHCHVQFNSHQALQLLHNYSQAHRQPHMNSLYILIEYGEDALILFLISTFFDAATDLSGTMRGCSVLQEEESDVHVVVVRSHMEWSQAVLALYVRVGVLLQQELHHLDVTVLSRDV